MSRRPVGSIRWRSPGVARVELQAGHDPITGKPRRMSETVHGTDADAERALARMLIEIGRMPAGGKMTVEQFVRDVYVPALPGRVRRKTREGYESKLDNHVLPRLGHIQLADLEPYVLDRWRDELLTKMSGRAALNVYRVFSTALNRAVKWRLIQSNPLLAVDAPRAEMRDLETLEATEAVNYLGIFRGHQIEPIVILAIATGMRPCELCALTWSDLDLKAGEVKVRRGLHQKRSETWFEPVKSKRSHRIVTLDDGAVAALKPLRGLGPLVPGDGCEGHMKPTEVTRLYRRQIRQAKARFLPLRDLRHSHATLLIEAGVDVVAVSRRLGHSTVAITDAYYLRPRRSADQAAASALGNLLAGSGGKSASASNGGTSKDV